MKKQIHVNGMKGYKMEKVSEDKSKTIEVRKSDIDPARIIHDAHEVIRDLKILADRMQDIVANNEVPAGLLDMGVVICVASGGSPDFTMALGTRKGIIAASKGIIESISEVLKDDTGDESSKDSEKDN